VCAAGWTPGEEREGELVRGERTSVEAAGAMDLGRALVSRACLSRSPWNPARILLGGGNSQVGSRSPGVGGPAQSEGAERDIITPTIHSFPLTALGPHAENFPILPGTGPSGISAYFIYGF
jgi:hypothetical protein